MDDSVAAVAAAPTSPPKAASAAAPTATPAVARASASVGARAAAQAPAATGARAAAAGAATASSAAAARAPGAAAGARAPAAPTPPAPSTRSAPSVQAAVRASPAAERLAAREGVDLARVSGTGRGGVVSKPDVVEHIARGPDAGVTGGATDVGPNGSRGAGGAEADTRETREKMSTRRKRIAENLLQAQHATAHLTTFNEIDMSAVIALRDRLRARVEAEQGVKLSYMPFFVKAACLALEQYPMVNAQIEGETIVYKHYVNMGIAVASEQGLIVPVIRDADRKSMLDVAREIADLATRARAGKLAIEDLTGGSFTITNGGVFGSLVSTPIINYPQVGILGLHKIQDRPVAVNGQVVIRPMMYVALSYDHRLVDGQQAVLFLVRIKELMEDPAAMLVA
jgi:2-oxoglutarate dehydrogenase E2 component (dihydrolipoamide succinyltransferase)